MNHTAGPWAIERRTNLDESTDLIVYYKNRDERLPEVLRADICFIQRQTSEDSRNAALISAAPEMLMALELILNDDRLMNALNKQQARAVIDSIAKATGSLE